MTNILLICFGYFILTGNLGATTIVRYDGHSLLRLHPASQEQFNKLLQLGPRFHLDYWRPLSQVNTPADVRVSPPQYAAFIEELKAAGISYDVVYPDIQKLITSEQEEFSRSKRTQSDIFEDFQTQEEILTWMQNKLHTCPNDVSCELVNIGSSLERRPLYVAKVNSINRYAPSCRQSVFVGAGIHAREWISPSTALYILDKIVNSDRIAAIASLVKKYDWYILPVMNPDGYHYTRIDRLWRKNRRPGLNSSCTGVDINRNFDFHWSDFKNPIDIPDHCQEDYGGRAAFSEPETRAIRDFLLKGCPHWVLGLDLHSYGPMFLMPWGHTSELPSDYEFLLYTARKATDAMKTAEGLRYVVGTPPQILYPAYGTLIDWMKGVAGFKYSYTIELRGSSFIIDRTEILPTGRETWAGLQAALKAIEEIERVGPTSD